VTLMSRRSASFLSQASVGSEKVISRLRIRRGYAIDICMAREKQKSIARTTVTRGPKGRRPTRMTIRIRVKIPPYRGFAGGFTDWPAEAAKDGEGMFSVDCLFFPCGYVLCTLRWNRVLGERACPWCV
jgi:hypothetical protein